MTKAKQKEVTLLLVTDACALADVTARRATYPIRLVFYLHTPAPLVNSGCAQHGLHMSQCNLFLLRQRQFGFCDNLDAR